MWHFFNIVCTFRKNPRTNQDHPHQKSTQAQYLPGLWLGVVPQSMHMSWEPILGHCFVIAPRGRRFVLLDGEFGYGIHFAGVADTAGAVHGKEGRLVFVTASSVPSAHTESEAWLLQWCVDSLHILSSCSDCVKKKSECEHSAFELLTANIALLSY